ncbi:DUF2971 domain-containing protein [Rhodoferax bucti]|uniref:DUF2971 domain-containing protein n=1 Tax=Rhodoferax bucti TaxID=2576305 RepID=UPI001108EB37|nr:DUF2971 domain-containing protein [Rhodoferax bucti]
MTESDKNSAERDLDRLMEIFFPNEQTRRQEVIATKTKMVHYTSSEVAVSIIRGKEIWMRNSSLMNDWSEINHGLDCLAAAYNQNHLTNNFSSALDAIRPGLRQRVESHFNSVQDDLKSDTYLTCVSQHLESENSNGRLSMWRAYGGQNGVALVFNSDIFGLKSDVLKAYSSPVVYGTENELAQILLDVTTGVMSNLDWLRSIDEQLIYNCVFQMWRFAALCTKHPGFEEEREWRIVYSPKVSSSEKMQRSVEVVRGIPQIVYKLPLKDFPDEGHIGAQLPQLLDRVIIGPTSHPVAAYRAFVDLLTEAGVDNAHQKVFTSGIPLR